MYTVLNPACNLRTHARNFLALITILFFCSLSCPVYGVDLKSPGGATPQHNPASAQGTAFRLEKDRWYFGVGGGGRFQTRDSFKYIIPTHEEFPWVQSTISNRTPYSIDSFGGGGSLLVGRQMDEDTAIEFSLGGTAVSYSKKRTLTTNVSGTVQDSYVVPVIDGQTFVNQQVLLFNGRPNNTPNLATKLEYDSWYLDTFLGLNRSMLKKTDTELHGVIGPAYAHFYQDFEHTITGTSFSNGLPVSSDLDEDITDDLFGLKAGFRLSHNITKKFKIAGSLFGGGYYRTSDLDAKQTLTNVRVPWAGTNINVSASKDDDDDQFVPRGEADLKIGYMPAEGWEIALSSGIDVWGNMSNVDNPEIAGSYASTGTSINKPVHIDDDDTFIEYRMGLWVSFSH